MSERSPRTEAHRVLLPMALALLFLLLLAAACAVEENGSAEDREEPGTDRRTIFSSPEGTAETPGQAEDGSSEEGSSSLGRSGTAPVAVTPSAGVGDSVSAPSEPVTISPETQCPRRQPDPNVAQPPAVTSPETDKEALVALFEATNGESWDNSGTWAGLAPIGQWPGVTVNEEGRVISLELSKNVIGSRIRDLRGKLPPELGNLSSLQALTIGEFHQDTLQLTGEIPPELGNLSSLQALSIVNSQLAGGIPPELGRLPSLRSLALAGNRLAGEIPPELGSLASLESLNLSGNQLCGEIPPELDALAGLRALNLGNNQLTGEFPSWLAGLSYLESLHLGNNQLTGVVPVSLENLALQLYEFNLAGNLFEGCISSFLVASSARANHSLPICTEVQPGEAETLVAIHQALGQPQLPGWLTREPLHTWHGVAVGFDGRVALLDMQGDVQGPVELPPELGNLAGLKHLRLDLYGSPVELPPELGNLTALQTLIIGDTLTGDLPPELGKLTALRTLDITGNFNLEGCSEGASSYQAGTLAQLCEPVGKFVTFSPTGACRLLDNGSLACGWGGNIDYTQSWRPLTSPLPPEGKFTSVSTSFYYFCGVRTDGSLACRWPLSNLEESDIIPDGEFASVSTNSQHACGVKTDGSLACWGSDNQGQATPPEGQFTSVSAGVAHSCGVRTGGSLACWGANNVGQATPPEGQFTSVSAGVAHSCGVKTDGSLACWGEHRNIRAAITPPEGKFTSVSAGDSHSCALRDDGSVACWWGNRHSTPPEEKFTSVSAEREFSSCGMTTDGHPACWDFDGSVTPYADSPFGSDHPSTFSRVYAGADGYCATPAAGAVEQPQSWCVSTAQ